MYGLCIFILLVFSTLCESVHKSFQVPVSIKNVGKFGRNVIRKTDLRHIPEAESKSSATLPMKRSFGEFKLDPNTKPLDFNKIVEKRLEQANRSHSGQGQPGFGKLIKDYFSKVGWRSPGGRLSLAPQTSNLVGLKVDPFAPVRGKVKFANINFKNRVDSNIARFNEPRTNYSESPFQLPESVKVNSQIKDPISQSLFFKPHSAETNHAFKVNTPSSPVNIGISDNMEYPSSNSINLNVLFNKNISDVLTLRKPDLPSGTAALSIFASKMPDVSSFKIIRKDPKLGFNNTYLKPVDESGEKILQKNISYVSDAHLKNKITNALSANEDGQINSARRLFDVIQSQNPLDLFNIPLLLNSFKLDSRDASNKYISSSALSNSTGTYVDELKDKGIPALTTKTYFISDHIPKYWNDITISKVLSHPTSKNNSLVNSFFPLGALSGILQQGFSNMPLVIIPLNRINFDSTMMTNPENNVFDPKYNSDINQTLEPVAQEMRKVVTFPDLFSNHFNKYVMTDMVDYGKSLGNMNNQTEAVGKLPKTNIKEMNNSIFKKKVDLFLKLSGLNESEVEGKIDDTLKNLPASNKEHVCMKDLNALSNTSRLTQEAKKSKLYNNAQSILPLLKVTANMALSKYSTIPIEGKFPETDKKLSNDLITSKEISSSNLSERNRTALNIKNLPTPEQKGKIPISLEEKAFSLTNISVNTESFIDKEWRSSDKGLEKTIPNRVADLPLMLNSKHNPKVETVKLNPSPQPLSAVMETMANNFILQSINNFKQNLNYSNLDNLTQSTVEDKESNPFLLENHNKIYVEKTTNHLNEPNLLDVQRGLSPNVSTYNNNHINSRGKEKSFVDSKNDNLNLSNDISKNKIEEKLSLKIAVNDTFKESDLNSTFSQNSNKKVVNIDAQIPMSSSVMKNNNNINLAQRKGLISMIKGNVFEGVKCLKNSDLQGFSDANLFPLEISDVNDKYSSFLYENIQATTTQSVLFSEANVKQCEKHWDVKNVLSDNASNYLGNTKQLKYYELPQSKNIKNEYLQIPEVVLEMLNRLESIDNNSYSGYSMLFLPFKKKKIDKPKDIKPSKSITTSIKPETTTKTVTEATEQKGNTNTENNCQVVSLGINSDTISQDMAMITTNNPLPEASAFTHQDGEKDLPPNENVLTSKSLGRLNNNNQPIILLAIDPLKTWESLNSQGNMPKQIMPHEIIMKTTSLVSNPELNGTIVSKVPILIGEPPVNLGEVICTTPHSGECKCKEVTLYPIYPMYPVYPLKPIIASNDTSTLLVNTF